MRWKSLFGGMALLLGSIVGCKQPIFMTTQDLEHYSTIMPVPDLSHAPGEGDTEQIIPVSSTPATVLDPGEKTRLLSLAEAIALALEGGTVGNTNALFLSTTLTTAAGPGTGGGTSNLLNDQSVGLGPFGGPNAVLSASDAIRVIRLNPAAVGANVELALSRFDAIWNTSMNWTTTDQPVGTPLQTFQAGGATGLGAIVQEQATFSSTLVKPLPTGGLAGITFNLPYTQTNLPARVNPAYQPQLQFSFEQPLLRGYGIEINQVAQSHPGSILGLVPFFQGSGNPLAPSQESILVSRVRFDQLRTDFERQINVMVLNVEVVYWNLYYTYWELYANEQNLRQAYETWKVGQAKFQAGQFNVAEISLARANYEQARAFRLAAMVDVQEQERQLRGLIGLKVADGCRLIPCDTPTLAPFHPDWCLGLQEAMQCYPDLAIARQEVKANQMNIIALKNQLLPDLRFTAQYDSNSIGTNLNGPGNNNALQQLAGNNFNDWNAGIRLIVPLGFRSAHANLRNAQLRLAQSFEVLRNFEQRVERNLCLQYRKIVSTYELIKIQRSQREAFAEQLRARFQEFISGRREVTINVLLQAQQQWAQAMQQEYLSIRDYNNAIVAWEFSKGTNLARNSIIINEGMLPVKAQKRAVEHERERERAIPLRERALPIEAVPMQAAPPPELQVNNGPDKGLSLVNLWEKDPPLLNAPALPPVADFPAGSSIQQVQATTSTTPESSGVVPATLTTRDAVKVGPPTPSNPTSAQKPASTIPVKPLPPSILNGPGVELLNPQQPPSGSSSNDLQPVPAMPAATGTSRAALLAPPPAISSGSPYAPRP